MIRAHKFMTTVLLCAAVAFGQSREAVHTHRNQARTPSTDQAIVLTGGKLLTITHGTIDHGVIVMEGGKIAAVGKAGEVKVPANAKVIDVTGMTVYPGLIDSETHLGLTEIEAEKSTNDLVELSDEIMPQMHVTDAFHAESALIPVTRYNGILNAVVAPATEDTLPGQDAFIQLAGTDATEMLIGRDVAMPLNFDGTQRRNETWATAKYPMTRMGMAAQLRQAFIDAQEYGQRLDDYNKKKAAGDAKAMAPKRDLKLEALLPYLRGQKPVVIGAVEPSDIETAVGLAKEFNLKFILNHLTHCQPILDYVASLKVPVIVGPIYEFPKDEERYDSVYRLPAELQKRGVKIAFASYDAHQSRNLPYAAGYAVAYGLPYDEALKAITINAAEIWGVADKLGSLDVGKTANVVVSNGDPLDVKTDVKHIFVAGQEIPLKDRQTELRDEYSK
ncbi:MAG TPA: amidohydrolase family protein [Terriglobales bacterium]|nr:amidohydrolase family protein [Terriglobales bacterium]